ncbi:MAG: DegT/DnrJ/EryC1/StrS family aminotransferase [Paludibacteraceae bacterium]|nr:DegT/DnrJ/EryC1/StrS family aminotransferase [Paludibacteraceae bacterium]
MKEPISVTSPLLPDLNEYNQFLQDIWSRKWITNNGHYHQELEKQLSEYLDVPYLSLFTNGTLPLITALQALGITDGEVITTPYSFVATTHSIWWNGLKPVFVDVDSDTGNIDPNKIEAAITDKTVAIMPVHVYGCPCDVERIDAIAKKHNLKVIYDAAHAFGVTYKRKSILEWGDLSTLSFHATKVYNTIEGGAMVMHSPEMKYDVDNLKNFGFRGETTVVAPGINSKMDEMRAAYGILNLKQVDWAIEQRKHVATRYVEALKDVKGIKLFPYIIEQVNLQSVDNIQFNWNFAYFPILITEDFGMTRDELYEHMKSQGVMGRRYFYPLISDFNPYSQYESAKLNNLPEAIKLAKQVICLPMHPYLSEKDVKHVLDSIVK